MSSFENLQHQTDPAKALQELFEADQEDRSSSLLETDELLFRQRDRGRYQRALEFYALYQQEPLIFSGEMKFNLALLFQHGTSAEDYKKAFELAQAAKKDGFDGAETLVRASEDRYLLARGLPQRWGTQSFKK